MFGYGYSPATAAAMQAMQQAMPQQQGGGSPYGSSPWFPTISGQAQDPYSAYGYGGSTPSAPSLPASNYTYNNYFSAPAASIPSYSGGGGGGGNAGGAPTAPVNKTAPPPGVWQPGFQGQWQATYQPGYGPANTTIPTWSYISGFGAIPQNIPIIGNPSGPQMSGGGFSPTGGMGGFH